MGILYSSLGHCLLLPPWNPARKDTCASLSLHCFSLPLLWRIPLLSSVIGPEGQHEFSSSVISLPCQHWLLQLCPCHWEESHEFPLLCSKGWCSINLIWLSWAPLAQDRKRDYGKRKLGGTRSMTGIHFAKFSGICDRWHESMKLLWGLISSPIQNFDTYLVGTQANLPENQ